MLGCGAWVRYLGEGRGRCLAYGQPQRACAWSQVHGVLKQGEQRNKCATTTPRHHPPCHHPPCHYLALAMPLPCTRHATTSVLAMPLRTLRSPCRYAENKPEEGRYVWLDLPSMARYREIYGDIGRCREIYADGSTCRAWRVMLARTLTPTLTSP